jgi:hypothetical protein
MVVGGGRGRWVVGGGGLLEGVLAVADEVADLLARGEDLAVLSLHS